MVSHSIGPRTRILLVLSAGMLLAACAGDASFASAARPDAATGRRAHPFFGVGRLKADTSINRATGGGLASPIGHWTYVVGFPAGFGPNGAAKATITVANGAKLFARIDTTIVPGCLPPNARNRFVLTVTGGTGRYAHATGRAEGEVQEQKVELPLVQSTLWWRGTIRY